MGLERKPNPVIRGVEWVLESRNSISVVPVGWYYVRLSEDGTFSVSPALERDIPDRDNMPNPYAEIMGLEEEGPDIGLTKSW